MLKTYEVTCEGVIQRMVLVEAHNVVEASHLGRQATPLSSRGTPFRRELPPTRGQQDQPPPGSFLPPRP